MNYRSSVGNQYTRGVARLYGARRQDINFAQCATDTEKRIVANKNVRTCSNEITKETLSTSY